MLQGIEGAAWDLPMNDPQVVLKLPWPGRLGMRIPTSDWPEAAAFSAAQVTGFFAETLAAQP